MNKSKPARQLFEVARKHFEAIVTTELLLSTCQENCMLGSWKGLELHWRHAVLTEDDYPVPVIATIFKNAKYKLTGIDYKIIDWGHLQHPSDIKPETQTALVACVGCCFT